MSLYLVATVLWLRNEISYVLAPKQFKRLDEELNLNHFEYKTRSLRCQKKINKNKSPRRVLVQICSGYKILNI